MDERYLEHSWGPWKNHKYTKKEGNRYYYDAKTGVKITKDSLEKQQVQRGNQSFREANKKDLHKNDVNTDRAKSNADAMKDFRKKDSNYTYNKNIKNVTDQNKAFREVNQVKVVRKASAAEKLGNLSKGINKALVNAGKSFIQSLFTPRMQYTDATGKKVTVKAKPKKGKK